MSHPSFRRGLLTLLLAFCALWAILYVTVALPRAYPPAHAGREFIQGDAGQYHALAVSLATRGTYALDGATPFFEREPGYSVFLSLVYRVFGIGNFTAVFVAQGVLHVLAVLCLAWSCQSFLSRRAQLIFMGLMLLQPAAFHVIFSLLRESFALSLAMLCAAAALQARERRSAVPAVLCGAALGWLILTYVPFLLAPAAFLPVWWLLRLRWGRIAVLTAVSLAVVGLWGGRNYALRGETCLTGCYRAALQWYTRGEQAETLRGLEPLRCLYAEYVSRDWTGLDPNCSFNAVWHRRWPQGFVGVPADREVTRAGIAKVLRYFPQYLWFSVFEVLELHLPYVNGWGRSYNVLAALGSLVLYAGALLSLPVMRRREYLLFGAFVLYVTGVFALTDATPRYLMPVFFCYAVAAAAGWDRVWERLAGMRRKRA